MGHARGAPAKALKHTLANLADLAYVVATSTSWSGDMALNDADQLLVRTTIANFFDVPVDQVLPHHTIMDDLDGDSLDCAELELELETVFVAPDVLLKIESDNPTVQDYMNALALVRN